MAEINHLPGCCVHPGAGCDCAYIVDLMLKDAEAAANAEPSA